MTDSGRNTASKSHMYAGPASVIARTSGRPCGELRANFMALPWTSVGLRLNFLPQLQVGTALVIGDRLLELDPRLHRRIGQHSPVERGSRQGCDSLGICRPRCAAAGIPLV